MTMLLTESRDCGEDAAVISARDGSAKQAEAIQIRKIPRNCRAHPSHRVLAEGLLF